MIANFANKKLYLEFQETWLKGLSIKKGSEKIAANFSTWNTITISD